MKGQSKSQKKGSKTQNPSRKEWIPATVILVLTQSRDLPMCWAVPARLVTCRLGTRAINYLAYGERGAPGGSVS